jgi:ribosomal protein L6P/L9E
LCLFTPNSSDFELIFCCKHCSNSLLKVFYFLSFWWNLEDTVDLGSISFRVLVQVQQKIIMPSLINNLVVYGISYEKKLFCLVLSVSKGWGLINTVVDLALISNQTKMHIFTYSKKSYFRWLESVFLGFQAGYTQYIVLKGMGFKFLRVKSLIVLKIGYSHRIFFFITSNTCCLYLTKYILKVNCRSVTKLTRVINSFLATRKKSIYKKKGIFIKGSTYKVKLSSKKAKF